MNINENTDPNELTNNSQEGVITDSENSSTSEEKSDLKTINLEYKLGWNKYSENTNGRFAMIGFFAILLIELLTHQSFLNWAGIFN